MRVLCDFNIIIIGQQVSISKYVADCEKILKESGLKTKVHAFGTNIEGEWGQISEAIEKCHNYLHETGVLRLLTSIKISSRIDRIQTLEEKVESVKKHKKSAELERYLSKVVK